MRRICGLFMSFVVSALLAGAGGVLAQNRGLQSTQQQPESDQVARVATIADLTFTRFSLQDPMLNAVWRHSHTIVDGLGGVHLVFNDYDNIYYAHCTANCDDPDNWLELPLFATGEWDSMNEPTLGVDAGGHPRLMWFTEYSEDTDSHYYYAECNSNCVDSTANWTSVAVVTTSTYPDNIRYFALDTQGRPRLVYEMTEGFYYVTCDAGCTTASNWHATTISTPDLLWPRALQLTFDPYDRPRVLGYDDKTSALIYAECNSNCAAPANWGSVGLFAPVDWPYYSFALRLDAQGHPRVAYQDASGGDNVLHYAWSNAAPLTAGGWSSYTLSYPTCEYYLLDLALDSQGRPSVAFSTNELDLSYATCTANCESASPTWQQQLVETGDELDAIYPIAPVPGCSPPAWVIDGYPSLALDAAGKPNVSYYVKHAQLCENPPGTYQTYVNAKTIRFATAGSSSTPTAPSSLTLSGPPTGTIDIPYTFTATISPVTATIPITYVWQATGQAAQTHTGGGVSDTASFTWPAGAAGVKTVAVTASNAAGSASQNRTILIYAKPVVYDHWIYLPVVLKS